MIIGIQIVGIIFGLIIMYMTFDNHKKKNFTAYEKTLWFFLALVFILITLFPNILDPITDQLELIRTMYLLVTLGFMFLLGINFYMYIIVRKNQKKIEKVVREIAKKEK